MITTLGFYLYAKPVFLKTLVTTSYALLVYYVLHVAFPRINEAKYFIISHVACKYTYIKHSRFSFIAFLLMPHLSEHDWSGAIGMLKAGVRFWRRQISQLPSVNSASEIVTRLQGQLKIDAGLVSQEWGPALRSNLRRSCIDNIYIDDIRSTRLLSVSDE